MPPGCSWHPRLHHPHLLSLAPHPEWGLLPPHPSPHIFGSWHCPHALAQLCHCQSSSWLPGHQEPLRCDTVGDIPRCQPSVTRCPLWWDGTGGVSGRGCPSQGAPGAGSSGDGGSQPGPRPDPSKSNQSRNSASERRGLGSVTVIVLVPAAPRLLRGPGARQRGHSRMGTAGWHRATGTQGWPKQDGHGGMGPTMPAQGLTGHPDLSDPVGGVRVQEGSGRGPAEPGSSRKGRARWQEGSWWWLTAKVTGAPGSGGR